MIDVISGGLAGAALYWLPGWVFLRKAGLDRPTRIVAAVGLSYAAVTVLMEALGALNLLGGVMLGAVIVILVILAFLLPFPDHAFEDRPDSGLSLPLVAVGLTASLVIAQAHRPALIVANDALATWAPLAVEIAETGTIDPGWLPTLLEGFPPSVGLIGGSVALLTGGFVEAHLFMVHPVFTTLLLTTVVLLAGWLGGRRASWIALVTMLATPLLQRGLLFHDDMIASFFTISAVLLAIRAKTTPAWALAGAVAESAVAVKHLGILAALLVGVVLIARHPTVGKWAAAAAGWLVGLPWYIWNTLRFGNPVYPLLPQFFGESDAVLRLVADNDTSRLVLENRSAWDLGSLTLVLIATGMIGVVWQAVRERDRFRLTFAAALTTVTTVYALVWHVTGFATRHLIIVLPVVAAVTASGLTTQSRRAEPGVSPVAMAGLAGLVGLTAWSVGSEFYPENGPPDLTNTGVFETLRGKWGNLERVLDPPQDPVALFGPGLRAWRELQDQDPEKLVLSFDNRSYYMPQRGLSATDETALSVYDAVDTVSRHHQLVRAGVGYVINLPGRSGQHPFYQEEFWRELGDHPDLYIPILVRDRVRLYRVADRRDG